jgi:hypothetical protein
VQVVAFEEGIKSGILEALRLEMFSILDGELQSA